MKKRPGRPERKYFTGKTALVTGAAPDWAVHWP